MGSENPQNPRPEEDQLGQAWDAFLAGRGVHSAGMDNDLFATIEQLHAVDDVPALDAATSSRIWRDAAQVARIAISQTVPLQPASAVSPNGRHAPPDQINRMSLASRWDLSSRLSGSVRIMAIGALAGMIAGAIGGGIVGRLAMRIVALMAEPWQQGFATDNGNAVGEITLGGSLSLISFTAIVGIAGGIVYVLIRPWLPGSGVRRGALFGLLLLLTSGWFVMDPNNPDYRRFGDPSVNIVLFSLIYIAFGLIVAPLADRFDRAIPAPWPLRSRRLPVLGGSALLILLAVPAILMLAGFAASPSGLLLAVLILGSRALVPRWAGRFERPADLLARPRVAIAAYAAIGIPALAGAAITLRAIGEILTAG